MWRPWKIRGVFEATQVNLLRPILCLVIVLPMAEKKLKYLANMGGKNTKLERPTIDTTSERFPVEETRPIRFRRPPSLEKEKSGSLGRKIPGPNEVRNRARTHPPQTSEVFLMEGET
ncbi:hypothetical protein NL676_023468 [Syzygium grande]|nr:hypothetical protein NL676_023468 [Syzygium grande]